jgi:hypothetical protein
MLEEKRLTDDLHVGGAPIFDAPALAGSPIIKKLHCMVLHWSLIYWGFAG